MFSGRCIVILAFLSAAALGAGPLDDAIALEHRGDSAGAEILYLKWLDENPRHERYVDVLIHTASLRIDPAGALELLEQGEEDTPPHDVPRLLVRRASLEAMMGHPDRAALLYERASHTHPSGDSWRFAALALRISMGQADLVIPRAVNLAAEADDPVVRDEAHALLARAWVLNDDPEKALNVLSDRASDGKPVRSPLFWLVYYDIALARGRREEAARALAALERDFPRSAAAHLARERIQPWPDPTILFSSRRHASLPNLQVGVYRKRESASTLRETLQDKGFTSWLEQENGLWHVIVADVNGKNAEKLKEAGYDFIPR